MRPPRRRASSTRRRRRRRKPSSRLRSRMEFLCAAPKKGMRAPFGNQKQSNRHRGLFQNMTRSHTHTHTHTLNESSPRAANTSRVRPVEQRAAFWEVLQLKDLYTPAESQSPASPSRRPAAHRVVSLSGRKHTAYRASSARATLAHAPPGRTRRARSKTSPVAPETASKANVVALAWKRR